MLALGGRLYTCIWKRRRPVPILSRLLLISLVSCCLSLTPPNILLFYGILASLVHFSNYLLKLPSRPTLNKLTLWLTRKNSQVKKQEDEERKISMILAFPFKMLYWEHRVSVLLIGFFCCWWWCYFGYSCFNFQNFALVWDMSAVRESTLPLSWDC